MLPAHPRRRVEEARHHRARRDKFVSAREQLGGQGVAAAFAERDACLLANHGLVTAGATLSRAMKVAQEVESLCEVCLKALAVGEPALLTRAQMDEVIKKFKGYGRAAALGAVTSMPRTTTSSAERDDGGLHRPASIPATSR